MSPRRIHDRALEASGTAAGLAYGAVAGLMTLDIALRAADAGALAWLTELTEYLMYGATFLAAAWTLRQGAHVRVDLLLAALPRRAGRTLGALGDAVGVAVSAVFVLYGGIALVEAWRADAHQYKTWAVPEWLLLAPLPLGGLLLMIEFGLRAAGRVRTEVDPAQRGGL